MFRLATRSTRVMGLTGRRMASTEVAPVYQNKRFVPNEAKAKEFQETYEHTKEHANSTFGLWKNISIWVCVPALIASGINSYYIEKEHAEHREHNSHIPDEDMPTEFLFQNVRNKKYFWGDGDKTLFWNEKANRHVPRD
ncbi:cytochrome c oxidase subunit VIa [Sugiyamaella lignohabitans]|uniref:Cytochrome c oxidase subunit 13, mitochondrial n=1 Tax=Sugiyamaella lignohabitans TaxID=796027 RepID=A0A167EJB8_9ASCO|nr:cytochrome c oxidase subunit VIa [Sugiyamaella lignohabitans]ANB14148.1 cytochrome c oxidase subunit VIa [Sugiyamaella lignohabitans]